MPSLAARSGIALVMLYKATLAHVLGGHCRFNPTCSDYAVDALRTHGALQGTWLTLRRIGRCHPWGPSGDDPVPGTGGTSDDRPSPRPAPVGRSALGQGDRTEEST